MDFGRVNAEQADALLRAVREQNIHRVAVHDADDRGVPALRGLLVTGERADAASAGEECDHSERSECASIHR
ncbi:hypothetical protein GCM10009000_122640 [Halobacterium noricense]